MPTVTPLSQDQHTVRDQVRTGYAQIARDGGSCCPTGCGAEHLGYDAHDLALLPAGTNMGLSCGNPTALASLQPGEVVLDLGSGGGFDAFIAARRVGPTGHVIGVDMTPEMIAKARHNLPATGLTNVWFRLGEIEHLPVADGTVDVVLSNCVLNLSTDKPQVWREIARVLKPGGRVAISDLALLQPLPATVRESVEALIACVAGAVLVGETESMMQAAGLKDIRLTPKSDYAVPGLTEYVTSLNITARK